MGPACFLATLMVIFYWAKLLKKKIPVWMWLGSVSSLVGSVILIIAPGNYVRSGLIVEESIWEVLYNRFFSMFMGAFSFMFPTLFFGILFLILYYKAGNKLQPYQIILLLTMLIRKLTSTRASSHLLKAKRAMLSTLRSAEFSTQRNN